MSELLIAVVLPCFRSKAHVLGVIQDIGPEVSLIIAVDDACPEQTGTHIEQNCSDVRVIVIRNSINSGVGGAMITGYREALARGADVVVKIDSDGQMDPLLLPDIVHPIVAGIADYSKGNRFFNVEGLRAMPKLRLLGNACLSFLTKLSSGYWNVFDPTNGYTAIHRVALHGLQLEKVDRRFFFESDMLFRLYLAGAVVIDVPMQSVYRDEISNLRISSVMFPFAAKNLRNCVKRILYRYFLRDMNFGSIELVASVVLLAFGLCFGGAQWIQSAAAGEYASAGTVMLAGLPILVGIQMLVGFLAFDVAAVPRVPLQRILSTHRPALRS